MMTAKLFENGRSQAVRLPKECRFDGDEVAINKVGDIVILIPKDNKWSGFLNSLELFSDDFMSGGREQPVMQEKQASAEQKEQSSGDSGQIQTGDMEEIQIEEINLQEQP